MMQENRPRRPSAAPLALLLLCAVLTLATNSACDADCSEASVVGTWVQVSASHPTRPSWNLERMEFRADCSYRATELEGSERSDRGSFSQDGDEIRIDQDEWSDRTGVLETHDRMVMDTASGWTVIAQREGGSSYDAGTVDPPPSDAGPMCTSMTSCVDVLMGRDNVNCRDRLQHALTNNCDVELVCGVALRLSDRYEDVHEMTVRPNQEGSLGGFHGECGVPLGAYYVIRCTLVGEPASCRVFGGSAPDADEFTFTCNDADRNAECIYYTYFDDEPARDAAFGRCTSLATLDRNVCPGSPTGGGYCIRQDSTHKTATYTYDSTDEAVRAQCSSTDGIWVSR